MINHICNCFLLQVLTLLALEAKQQSIRESSQKLKAKIFELPLEEGPAKHTRSAPSTSSLSRPPSRESSRDDSCSNEESDSQLMGNASDSPHKSYSIFGDTAKRPSVCIEENEGE